VKVLERLFRGSAGRGALRHDAQLADPLIDRIVAATDQRLALVRGYRERLRGAVAAAYRALFPSIARIPGPIEVSPLSWARDDTLRALFARAADTAAAFGNQEEVRDFFALHPAGDCFGLLALLPVERRVLAPALSGDAVQMEVARTTVSFTEPRVLAPRGDEASLREELVQRSLEYLALVALRRTGAIRAGKRELEQERALLRARLQVARRHGAGFGAIDAPSAGAGPGDVAALEGELERTVSELERLASRELLPALLDDIGEAMAHHADHLSLDACTLALDSMNFAVPPSAHAVTPAVSMLELGARGPFAVLVARFPRASLSPGNRLADAAKFL
jgi:hypothetical protein